LLVEDHEDTARALRRMLENAGYQVGYASTLASARDLAAKRHFQLVISDLGLPDGSGLDLMGELGDSGQLRGIALSGFGSESDVAAAKAAGFAEIGRASCRERASVAVVVHRYEDEVGPDLLQLPERLEQRIAVPHFFFQADDGIRDRNVTGVQTCAPSDLLGLPDGSGLDLMGELGDSGQLRGIALSGFGSESDVAAAKAAGFAAHFTKPVDWERLRHTIHRLLDGREASSTSPT